MDRFVFLLLFKFHLDFIFWLDNISNHITFAFYIDFAATLTIVAVLGQNGHRLLWHLNATHHARALHARRYIHRISPNL